MKLESLALLSEKAALSLMSGGQTVYDFSLYDKKYKLALVEKECPDFNEEAEQFAELILIKKTAFSLNFRDKGMLLYLQELINKDAENAIQVGIGSEFIAEVLKVGKNVRSLKKGDRVIPNAHYPSMDISKVNGGIPTNHASSVVDILHELQLIKVPDVMSDSVGASFTIGSQTAYGMIRRLQLSGNENLLITSATSSTSLFCLAALKGKVRHITVLTTQLTSVNRLKELGADEVVVIADRNNLHEEKLLKDIYNQIKGFDVVVDPFSDVYLAQLAHLINVNGKYATCGVYFQSFDREDQGEENIGSTSSLLSLISKNITLVFNCLGDTEDLKLALTDYAEGNLQIQIDSVFSGEDVIDFLSKSFCESEKLGKVVYNY